MFDFEDSIGQPVNEEQAFHLLRELEVNTSEEIRRQRVHFRISLKTGVVLQSANASELTALKLKGVTGDVSEGGCSALFPLPIRVGDVFRLQMDRKRLDLPLIFARCVRCRLVREDAFEAGFAFFVPITLPEEVYAGANADP
jgi:c-di-GMP-binding flagellar brake protein YcgR